MICGVDPLIQKSQPASDPCTRGGGKRPRAICKCGPNQNIHSVSRPRPPSLSFHHLQSARQIPEPLMEALEELKQKTRELRKGLMATTVLVDASVAVCNEWVSVVTDYVGPQLNHIAGKFLDHQVRDAGSLNRLYSLIYTWSSSSGSLSLHTDYHPRARARFFANGISASLILSREIVWRFQNSSGSGKLVMRTQGSMARQCSKPLLPLSRCACPMHCHL